MSSQTPSSSRDGLHSLEGLIPGGDSIPDIVTGRNPQTSFAGYDKARFSRFSTFSDFKELLNHCEGPDASIADLVSCAETLWQMDKETLAIPFLKRAHSLDPTHSQTLQLLGHSFFTSGQYGEGLEIARKMIQLHSKKSRRRGRRGSNTTTSQAKRTVALQCGFNLRGICYQGLGKFNLALRAFDAVIKLGHIPAEKESTVSFSSAHNSRSLILVQQHQCEEGIVSAKIATKLMPDNPKFWNNLGLAYHQNEDYELAQRAYDVAVELAPDYVRGRAGRAVNSSSLEDYETAISDVTTILSRSGGGAGAVEPYVLYSILGARADAYLSTDQPALALEDINLRLRIQENGSGDSHTLYNRGKALSRLGSYEEALSDLNSSLKLVRAEKRRNPADQEMRIAEFRVLYERGVVFANTGRLEESLRDARRALQIDHDSVLALRLRAKVLFDLGQSEKAFVDINRVLALKPSPDAFNLRGHCYCQKSLWYEAIADFLRSEDTPERLFQLGQLHMIVGVLEKSLEELSLSLERGESSLELHTIRGMVRIMIVTETRRGTRGRSRIIAAEEVESEIRAALSEDLFEAHPEERSETGAVRAAMRGLGSLHLQEFDAARRHFTRARELDNLETLSLYVVKSEVLMRSFQTAIDAIPHDQLHRFRDVGETYGGTATAIKKFGRVCVGCGCRKVKTWLCSRCKRVRYCSRECQRKNWKFHKRDCC